MDKKINEKKKSFFERMGEILNAPLPGTEAKPTIKLPTEIKEGDDDSLLARVKEILNTPLPGSDSLNQQQETSNLDLTLPEISQEDVQENWWETDWFEFKAHQDQDRKGLNMKQRIDQEDFAQYQEQERTQFEAFQAKEFALFQAQQQAKLYWIQEQQMKTAMGETGQVPIAEMSGALIPPPAPLAPLPPTMPTPPWLKTNADTSNIA